MNLNTKIKSLGGIYKRYSPFLEKLEITEVSDFLYHMPSRFEDFSIIKKIKDLKSGDIVTIIGTVKSIKNIYTKNYKKIQQAKITDETGEITSIWFNQPFLIKSIKTNDKIAIAGRIEIEKNEFKIISPDYEILSNINTNLIHTGRLVPIYPETRGVTSKWIRRQVYKILNENKENILEYIPYSILNNHDLVSLNEAFEQFHFPKNLESFNKAKERLSFDEILMLDLISKKRKEQWIKNKTKIKINYQNYKKEIDLFINNLPFKLTVSQQQALSDMFSDLNKDQAMNRLLLGDVGSGKTVVAAIIMYATFLNGYQSILMAPTEILAQQHFKTISNLFEKTKIKIGLQTGNSKSVKNNSLEEFDILIGTHALLSEKLNFKNLGLVIIDEQHRFGVKQRSDLRNKGDSPHFLSMSATPIPRTVILTLYGDLDVSILTDMPKGRKKIKTWLVENEKRNNAYNWIEKQITNGDQVFIICPFIEESENLKTVKAAINEFENLKIIFKNKTLGLIHGKIKSKEKDKILSDFQNKKIDILVATPVVEVGIDIPNATIILIEAAERFGLAQLHQLRGRVGRGEKQSFCLLFSESTSLQSRQRLKMLENINSGSELAEMDLKLRGSGDIYGTMQSGQKLLKIASFSDFSTIAKAKKVANEIFFQLDKYPEILRKIKELDDKEVMPD